MRSQVVSFGTSKLEVGVASPSQGHEPIDLYVYQLHILIHLGQWFSIHPGGTKMEKTRMNEKEKLTCPD